MKTPVWIAASLLVFLAVGPVLAQQPRRPSQDKKSEPPPRQESSESQASRSDQAQPGQPRLTPAERRKLRSDINAAGRDIYRRKAEQRLF